MVVLRMLNYRGQAMTFVSTEGKCKSEDERLLGWLKPFNPRTDRFIFVLRNAANIASTATLTRLEIKRALDSMRTEAAISLNEVCSLLDRGGLTQHAIDQAAVSVEAWLNALPRSKSRAAPTRPAARVC